MSLRRHLEQDLQKGRPDLAFDRLVEVLSSDRASLAEFYEAHQVLPCIAAQLPRAAFGARREATAARHGVALPEPRPAIGDLEFPAVNGGQARLVLVHARRVPDGGGLEESGLAGLPEDTRRALADALAAARDLLPAELRGPLQVTIERCEAPVQGDSCGLAVALAALSAATRRPIPPGIVATGAVARDGQVGRVGFLDGKRQILREARPWDMTRLLVPLGQEGADPMCQGVRTLGNAWRLMERAGPALWVSAEAPDCEQPLADVRAAFRAGRWPEAARRAQALLGEDGLGQAVGVEGLFDEEWVELRMILLAAANHRGAQEEAALLAAELRPALTQRGILPRLAAQALAHVAVQAVDLLRPAEAGAVLALADHLVLPPEDEGWVHIRGAGALVAVLLGEIDTALSLRLENMQRCPPDERARCLGDLADVYLRRGEVAAARAAVDQALGLLSQVPRRRIEYVYTTARYLHLHAARVARAEGRSDEALRHLGLADGAPGPGVLVELERALLAPDAIARLAAAERSGAGTILRALRLRALLLAGDPLAAPELAGLLGVSGVGVEELCRRLPY